MSLFESLRMRLSTNSLPTTSLVGDHIAKVIFMGAARVGKTSILSRLLFDTFHPAYLPTIEPAAYQLGTCVYRLQNTVGKKSVAFDFYDTPGFYQSPPMKEFLFTVADTFVLVYAIDEYRSFQEACSILKDIRHKRPDATVLFIGNKADLNAYRDVGYADVVKFGSSLGISVFETSAKADRSLYTPFTKYLQSQELFDTSPKLKLRKYFSR